jgi:hypothetical protein
MGQVFKFISDEALRELAPGPDRKCDVCGTRERPLYEMWGFLVLDDGTASESPEDQVELACAACINERKIARGHEEFLFEDVYSGFHNAEELRQEFRQTPAIPLMMQFDDWPVCCDHLCEFTGSPQTYEELLQFVSDATF